ncbi:MAG: acetyl-CoA C-acyltransferase, partial [Alphaproteobacteria bacterium]|nr:acetyl-CoA C-acyltransferase [Alphaproteobacteria bacterium]
MPEAYLCHALRTPVGRKKGALSGAHPADLGAHVLNAVVRQAGIDPAAVDDVIFGCVDTVGPQAGDIARTCWLAAGLPDTVPGVTLDRQCGSAQQAIHFAAQAVMSGTQDVVIAGGVQNMAMVPISQAMIAGADIGHPDPFSGSKGWTARYGTELVSQFRAAEMIAHKWECTTDDLHAWAYQSHQRAVAAQADGRFAREIVPYDGLEVDEGPRPDTTLEKMATLQPVVPGGRHTAADASQISVGAAAMIVANEAGVKAHGLTPLARVHHMTVLGDDPIWMLTAPIPATARALQRAGMSIDDIDLV